MTETTTETPDYLGTTWTISPSVSPKGTYVTLHLDNKGSSGNLYLNADQAHALAVELMNAADWARAHA